MVYTGPNVMPVGLVGIWSAGRKALVIKFNVTTSSMVVSKCSWVVSYCVFSLLKNSVYQGLQATNIPSNSWCRRPPKSQSGVSSNSGESKWKSKSNHKGYKLQLSDIIDMRNALVQYFSHRVPGYQGKKFGIRRLPMLTAFPGKLFGNESGGLLPAFSGTYLEVRTSPVSLLGVRSGKTH